MNKNVIEKLSEIIEKDANIEKNEDYIKSLFEQRAEEIYKEITNNKEYKNELLKLQNIDDEIDKKFPNNALEITQIIEERINKSRYINSLCEKLIYKHGFHDGIVLILKGLEKMDINKFIKEN